MTPPSGEGLLPPIPLDRRGPLPLQRQLGAALRALVLGGRLPPGRRLPSTRALAQDLELSRNTVMYAYDQLESEGYLVSRRGSGTFVAALMRADDGLRSRPSARSKKAPRLARRHERLGAHRAGPNPTPAPFAVGFPDPSAFPRALFARLSARIIKNASPAQLDYGDPRGLSELREAIATYLASSRGVRCTARQILVVHGSQQAIDLVGRVLLDPGDRVWFEEPGYHGARAAFLAAGAEVVPVQVDGEGLDPDAAPEGPAPRAVFVTPSNQFPSVVTMSLARRLRLLERARDHDAWIIEDDYDSEFRYRGTPTPALQGLDHDGRVLYVGTFSKTLAPALRLGYVVLPQELVQPFAKARSIVDQSPNSLFQAVLAEFLKQGHYARHIARMRRLYARRQAFLAEALEARFADVLRVRPADGGLHLVVDLDAALSEHAIWRALRDRGVQSVPMSLFHAGPQAGPGLLLGYAGFDEAAMNAALSELRSTLDQAADF